MLHRLDSNVFTIRVTETSRVQMGMGGNGNCFSGINGNVIEVSRVPMTGNGNRNEIMGMGIEWYAKSNSRTSLVA